MQSPKPTLKQRADQLGISDEDFDIFMRVMRELGSAFGHEFGAEGGKTAAANMTPEQRGKRASKAGKAGARARSAALPAEERSRLASRAAAARWKK